MIFFVIFFQTIHSQYLPMKNLIKLKFTLYLLQNGKIMCNLVV